MKRPAGVIVSMALLALGAVLCLLSAASILSALDYLQEASVHPLLMRAAALLAVGVLGLAALWQVTTLAGLWLMKSWGRFSLLVFSGLIVAFPLLSMLSMLWSPLPEEISGPPGHNQMALSTTPWIITFYLVSIGIGVWWLLYFTRPKVRAMFTTAAQAVQVAPRPLSIVLIAWAMVLTAALWPFAVYWQWPSFFLWVVLTGWGGVVANTAWCALSAYGGVGLLRWTRRGYLASMWLFGIATATVILFWIMPGAQARTLMILNTKGFPEMMMFTTGAWFWLPFLIALLGVVIPVGYLYAYRSEFKG